MKTLIGLGEMAIYMTVALVMIWFARHFLFRVASGQHIKLSNNIAANLRHAGVMIAIGVGMSGIFSGGNHNFFGDLTNSVGYTALLFVFVIVALKVNDWLVLPGVDNTQAVSEGNLSVAMVEVGGLIATGLIARAAFAGENGGYFASMAFFALGQLAMVLLVEVYEFLIKKRLLRTTVPEGEEKPKSIVKEVEAGNVAAGIILGGKLWAYGLVMATAAGGNFTSWTDGLTSFAVTAAAGMGFLYIAEWAIDKYVASWKTVEATITSKDHSSALMFAATKVAMAYVISTLAI